MDGINELLRAIFVGVVIGLGAAVPIYVIGMVIASVLRARKERNYFRKAYEAEEAKTDLMLHG